MCLIGHRKKYDGQGDVHINEKRSIVYYGIVVLRK